MDELDICAECSALGDDYYVNENGELVCACDECTVRRNMMILEDEQDDQR